MLLPEYRLHLIDLLLHHVLSGAKVMSGNLTLGTLPPLMNGGTANVTSLDPVMIDSATVVTADVEADNGTSLAS